METVLSKRKFEQDGFTVIVKRVLDDDADTSWLTQDYEEETSLTAEEKAEYRAQDKKRMDALNRGEWYFVGVVAEIKKQTKTNWADGGLTVGRASVWGTESDSEDSHFAELEADMVAEAFREVERLKVALCSEVK